MICPKCKHVEEGENVKFCNLCGAELINNEPQTMHVDEQLNKTLANAGNTVVALACLSLVVNSALFIYSIFSPSAAESGLPISDAPGFVLNVALSIIYIILGKRIRIVNNKDSRNYLWLITILLCLHGIWSLATGGRIGLLLLIALAYLISGIFKMNKALKNPEYQTSLIQPNYKIKKNHWAVLGIITFVIFIASFAFIPAELNSTPTSQVPATSIEKASDPNNIPELVAGIKSEMNLPQKLDEITKLTDVTAQPTAIRYHYELIDTDLDNIDQKLLRNNIKPSICSNSDTLALLNLDIGMEYLYSDQSNKTILLKFDKQDCL